MKSMSYRLSSRDDGTLLLEGVQFPRTRRLPPPLVLNSPIFSDVLATPPETPNLTPPPLEIRTPVFFEPLYTPPQTPEDALIPSMLPSRITTPEFLSPLLTPNTDDDDSDYFSDYHD